MNSPWGDIEAADAHIHFFSHRFFSMLAAQKGAGVDETMAALGWETPPRDPRELAARWAAELDRHGVARAALIASLPGDEESVAEAVAAFPSRFAGFFMVNPLAEDAADRARTAFDAGLRCPCLFPAMHRYPVAGERAAAIVEMAAARPGAAVFVHCGVLTVGVRRKLGLASPFDMRFSNPLDVHALAMRYPHLPFAIPHFGAGFLREALMLCDLCPNVYLDTSSSNSWMRYLEPGCTLATVFARALAIAGPKRLLFGTDSSFFPRGWQTAIFEEQARTLAEAGVGAEDARAIFGGNFRRLFP
jgi:predicted TIM-barrel fold metal-dependent hydrolase